MEVKKTKITKILDNIGSNFADVKRHKRLLGNTPISESNRPPLILVEFNEAVKRDAVCKSAHQLRKSAEFDGIYLNADKTRSVRILEQKLRERRNQLNSELPDVDSQGRRYGAHNSKRFYWAIRSNMLSRVYTE